MLAWNIAPMSLDLVNQRKTDEYVSSIDDVWMTYCTLTADSSSGSMQRFTARIVSWISHVSCMVMIYEKIKLMVVCVNSKRQNVSNRSFTRENSRRRNRDYQSLSPVSDGGRGETIWLIRNSLHSTCSFTRGTLHTIELYKTGDCQQMTSHSSEDQHLDDFY